MHNTSFWGDGTDVAATQGVRVRALDAVPGRCVVRQGCLSLTYLEGRTFLTRWAVEPSLIILAPLASWPPTKSASLQPQQSPHFLPPTPAWPALPGACRWPGSRPQGRPWVRAGWPAAAFCTVSVEFCLNKKHGDAAQVAPGGTFRPAWCPCHFSQLQTLSRAKLGCGLCHQLSQEMPGALQFGGRGRWSLWSVWNWAPLWLLFWKKFI